MPRRLSELKSWLEETLQTDSISLQPASTDASFRRYFRFQFNHRSLIAMDAPPDREQTEPFVRIAQLLHEAGLNAPEVLARNSAQGFLLLSDLGETPYLSVLTPRSVETLYADALNALYLMQTGLQEQAQSLPGYDAAYLTSEMQLFQDWYLTKECGLSLDDATRLSLSVVMESLAQMAVQQPRVFVHRDYHSRNLMHCPEHNPGILDFQDAMLGPVTYDLVSLLRDCYIAWPEEQVQAWALGYLQRAQAGGLIEASVSNATLLQWFDWMGVQRHLKASGIFARLKWRDDKPGYVEDIPRTLGYVRSVCARYPALQALESLLKEVPA